MSSEWPVLKIEDIAERVGMGPFGSSIKVETFVESGIPVISGEHLHDITLTEKKFRFITEQHAAQLVKSNVFRGDVVFTHAGTIGQVSVIPEDSKYVKYILSQRQFFMRCNRELVNPLYVAYFFKSPQGRHKLLANTSQVGVPSIARPVTYLRSIEIPVPSLAIQNRIVSVIESMRDRITLLQETNATLEALAQALFKSWFVDFDPVRAKSEGKLPEGIDEDTAALFPDTFDETETGMVPKGWRVLPFLDACDLQGGSQPPASVFIDELQEGYVRLLQIRDFSSDAHTTYIPDTPRLKKVGEDDVLIGRYGSASGDKAKDSLGRVCRGLSGAYNVALMKLNPILVGREFAFQLVSDPRFYNYLQGVSSKAVQSGFSKSELAQYTITLPNTALIERYEQFGVEFWITIKTNNERIKTLKILRDTLLPRLISGDLRIAEAEAELEKVTA